MTDDEIMRHLCSKPGLKKLADAVASGGQLRVVCQWMIDTWNAEQGSHVKAPAFMTAKGAAALTSFILQERASLAEKGGDEGISAVAVVRGSRFNTGKLRFDLIDGAATEGLAAVLTRGAEKYAAENWRDGLLVSECIASLERHLNRLKRGEDTDSETGLPHIDHIQCNAMFISNMLKTRPDMDDRNKKAMDLKSKLQVQLQVQLPRTTE